MNRTIYVSPNGRPFWTGKYPQPLEDMSDGPVSNLNYAKRLMHELNVNGMPSDFTVCIAGGTYRFDSPLKLGYDMETSITYKPYDGETVVISGGKVLDGWQEVQVNGRKALVAELPQDYPEPKQLLINGQPAVKACYPADGTKLQLVSAPKKASEGTVEGFCTLGLNPSDVENLEKLDSADIVLLHFWLDERLPITRFDAEKSMVYSTHYTKLAPNDDSGNKLCYYRLENVYSALKEEGQWFYDRKEHKVYYIPCAGQTAETLVAEIPICNQLFLIEGMTGKGGNIAFENIEFTCTNTDSSATIERYGKEVPCGSDSQAAWTTCGSISLKNADNCRFTNCTFSYLGGYAIVLENGCKCNTIENCTIHHCGGGGIKISGGDVFADRSQVSAYNRIENNYIHHCGLYYMQAVGIFTQNAFSTYIGHNTIHDLGYTGISCGWIWGYSESRSARNVIEYNHIYNIANGDLSDLAAIYTLGAQPGTVIRGNHIHHVKKAGYGGRGIYLDEGSAHIVVEKNIVHDTESDAFFFHYGKENIVRHNIFVAKGEGCFGNCRADKYTYATVLKNIFVTDGQPIFKGAYNFHFNETDIISDANFLYDIGGKPFRNAYLYSEGAGQEVATWQHWLDTGHDNASFVGDPGFASLDNFTLKEDSIAYKMGFPKDVSISLAGSSLCK